MEKNSASKEVISNLKIARCWVAHGEGAKNNPAKRYVPSTDDFYQAGNNVKDLIAFVTPVTEKPSIEKVAPQKKLRLWVPLER